VAAGSLTVVGTGIRTGVHLTPESRDAIDAADELLHLAADPLTDRWLLDLHPRSTSLRSEYHVGERREQIYERIVERLLAPVRDGLRVAAAFYGHPGVYVRPSHEAIRRARSEGHDARMLPAVSAEDCLFADLGIDPATTGCASYDATDFLLRPPTIDAASGLVLWQITVIGDRTAVAELRLDNVHVLVERLAQHYPRDHEVVVYEASPYPIAEAVIERVPLGALPDAPLTPLSTLYVPPATVREFDREMAVRLGFSTH
jgi:uncharacterized protein YabN with tetrapyrrole methylase and pyrophosphatase domain